MRGYTLTRLMLEAIALLSGGSIVVPIAWAIAASVQRASLFPQLVRLDSRLGRHFLLPSDAHLVPVGDGSLRVQPDQGRWPGVSLQEVWPDWRGYSTLVIDVSNTDTRPLWILVRIDDRRPDPKYRDRYNGEFELAPLSRQVIRIPVTEIESAPVGSKIDLTRMRRILLFEDGSKQTYSFYLNSLRLER